MILETLDIDRGLTVLSFEVNVRIKGLLKRFAQHFGNRMSPGVLVKDFQNGYQQHLVRSKKKNTVRRNKISEAVSHH